MEKRFIKPDKEELKRDFASYKKDFNIAIRDKKRWITCLIELLIMGAFLAVDQLTKRFVYGHCVEKGDIKIIPGVIRFTAIENTGASFGIFKNATGALAAVSLICALILIGFIFYSYPRRNLWLRSALILIVAGAIGNLVDRFAFGYVRDMVYFELINFAVFNFADSCLTVGTVALIIYILFYYNKDEEEARKKREEKLAAEKAAQVSTELNSESTVADKNDTVCETDTVAEIDTVAEPQTEQTLPDEEAEEISDGDDK